jgi:hypothetical protein
MDEKPSIPDEPVDLVAWKQRVHRANKALDALFTKTNPKKDSKSRTPENTAVRPVTKASSPLAP